MNSNCKLVKRAFFYSLILLVIGTAPVVGQRRVDLIPTTKGCYRQSVAPILYAPTLRTDMPLATLISYIYLDSLCRTLTSNSQIDSLASLITSSDTLKPFLKFAYALSKYDDDLLHEYLLYGDAVNPLYHVIPQNVWSAIQIREASILGSQSPTACIVGSSLILRIHVNSVEASCDSLATLGVNPLPLVCVSAIVLDTIKGMHFRDSWLHTQPLRKGAGKSTQDVGILNFSFSPLWKRQPDGSDFQSYVVDSSGAIITPCDGCYGTVALLAGHDYVVFLNNQFLDYDGTNAYYNYWPAAGWSPEGGIFPISDGGIVTDSANFFGGGLTLSWQDFEARLRTLISGIEN